MRCVGSRMNSSVRVDVFFVSPCADYGFARFFFPFSTHEEATMRERP